MREPNCTTVRLANDVASDSICHMRRPIRKRVFSTADLGWAGGYPQRFFAYNFSAMPAPKDVENLKSVEKKIDALREKIRHHEHLYYVLDNPEISDADFDKLMQQLKDLESQHPSLVTPDSPTQRVGGKPREGFVKVAHSSPMLSLDNTYSEEELRDWERRVHE